MVGPLDGYKILDFSQVVSGPLATMLLADQGAEVIKVEPLGMGDVTRLAAFSKGGMSAFYANNNRGKRALTIDIGTSEGKAVALELATRSDVIVQNFRPGAIERLGLGYDKVCAVNPEVVYLSISGFGPTGPYAGRPVLDPVIQGLTGVIDRQMNPEIPIPDLIRNLYADKSTALTAAQAVTAALLARERGHGGQHIELPMLDACLYFFWPDGMMDKTLLDDDVSPGFLLSSVYNITRTADGSLVYFVVNDAQRNGLFRAIGRPDMVDDARYTMAGTVEQANFIAMGEIIAAAFASFDTADVLDRLVAEDVPSGPVLDAEQVFADPQVRHNDTLARWQHPSAGEVRQPRPAARFSKTPAHVGESAPLVAEHNDEILAELGRSPAEIDRLRTAGIIP